MHPQSKKSLRQFFAFVNFFVFGYIFSFLFWLLFLGFEMKQGGIFIFWTLFFVCEILLTFSLLKSYKKGIIAYSIFLVLGGFLCIFYIPEYPSFALGEKNIIGYAMIVYALCIGIVYFGKHFRKSTSHDAQ